MADGDVDKTRDVINREGKEARNLVSWKIPIDPTNFVEQGSATNFSEDDCAKNDVTMTSSTKRNGVKFNSSSVTGNNRLKRVLDSNDYRALHWTHLFESLRRTVDAIYDVCQADQSIIECKEAIMILENYTKDFVALIEFLNAEAAWERSEKPSSIAWEIRKTIGLSPNKHIMLRNNTDGYFLKNASKSDTSFSATEESFENNENDESKNVGSPNMSAGDFTLPENSRDSDENCCAIEIADVENVVLTPRESEEDGANILEITKSNGLIEDCSLCADSEAKILSEGEWKVVTYSKHRKHVNVVNTSTPILLTPSTKPSRIVFPRNVQEIRQTKASLAKMEHNRQYLAEQRRKELSELSKSLKNRVFSLPSLYGTSNNQLGINFADVDAVKRIAQSAKMKNLRVRSGRKNRSRSYQSMESLCSLESIKEAEDETCGTCCYSEPPTRIDPEPDPAVPVPADDQKSRILVAPLPNSESAADFDGKTTAEQSTTDTDMVPVSEKPAEEHSATAASGDNLQENVDDSPKEETNFEDEEDEETWQHLTEEEESLAQEEENLQKEIEEERKSIDMEISRRTSNNVDGPQDSETADQMECDEYYGEKRQANENAAAPPNEQSNDKTNHHHVPVDAKPMTWQELVSRWRAEFPTSSLCFNENPELSLLTTTDVRLPGQVVQMHEKLSSPSRKRNNIDDTIRKQEERQAKAEEIRQRFLREQQERLSKLFRRVDEVRSQKACLLEKKRMFMEDRLAKATENRSYQLLAKVKKARDEDEKVHEIAFINSLEADNKRHDVLSRQQDHEMRLQSIQEERQRKVEEKAAREQAVEERRKAVEEERQTKLREMAERTRRRQEQIDQQRSELEHQRQQAAKEKAREREERLAERRAARQANTDELLHRIQQKQEGSLRRHEENLELIKQRANEMSSFRSYVVSNEPISNSGGVAGGEILPTGGAVSSSSTAAPLPPSTTLSCTPFAHSKFCTICNVLISSELNLLAHLKGSRHANSMKEKQIQKEDTDNADTIIIEAPDDKLQALNVKEDEDEKAKISIKRRQKIKQKIIMKWKEYHQYVQNTNPAEDTTNSHSEKLLNLNTKLIKADRDLEKCFTSCGLSKQWLPNDIHTLERSLNEINRSINTVPINCKEQEAFYTLKSRDILLKLLSVLEKPGNDDLILPQKCFVNVCTVLKVLTLQNLRLCLNVLYSGQIMVYVNALSTHLKLLIDQEKSKTNTNYSVSTGNNSKESTNFEENLCLALIALLNDVVTTLSSVHLIEQRSLIDTHFCGLNGFAVRSSLLISYFLACRCVDYIAKYVQISIEGNFSSSRINFIIDFIQMLKLFLKLLYKSTQCEKSTKEKNLAAQTLQQALKENDLCYLISFLYALLLNPSNLESHLTDVQLPPHQAAFVVAVLDFVNLLAVVDLTCFQEILSEERTSLEFRHIASFLICYSNKHNCSDILHRVIVSVGFFTCSNVINQDCVHAGSQPSILQQLCVLPFPYFSDPKLSRILFPTLIACCFQNLDNRRLLEEELSGKLLADFIEDNLLESETPPSDDPMSCDDVFSLRHRFPASCLEQAKEYFASDV